MYTIWIDGEHTSTLPQNEAALAYAIMEHNLGLGHRVKLVYWREA